MPVKLSDKVSETKVCTIKWGEDDVDVSYFVNAVTPALLEKVDQAAMEDNMSVLAVVLEPVIEWWDVLDDKGKRIGTDAATIGNLPLRWLVAVNKGLEADQDPPEGSLSGDG